MVVNPFFLPDLKQISLVVNSKTELSSQVKLEDHSPIKLTGSNLLKGPKILDLCTLVFSIDCLYVRAHSLS